MVRGEEIRPPSEITFQTLSHILRLTNTLTAGTRYSGQDYFYRSAASAGALYPNEIYLAHDGVTDLNPGLYHYGIRDQVLHILRQEKVLCPILEAIDFSDKTNAAASLLITGIFFRSAWKYRARAYRYVLLDAGHVLENLILALQSLSIPFSVHDRFHDREVNSILGINGKQEACMAVVHLYNHHHPAKHVAEHNSMLPLPETVLRSSRVSEKEVVYPEILNIHEAGEDLSGSNCPGISSGHDLGISVPLWQEIQQDSTGTQGPGYPDLLYRRRSKRNYLPRSIPLNDFNIVLDMVCASSNIVERPLSCADSLQVGFLAERVEGLTPGFYLLDPHERRIGLVQAGQLTGFMTDACLNQDWLAHAAVHFLLMADLNFLDQRWGARGYRHAMIRAGRIGQMIYLGATALNMGACGIGAFYDEEANAILDLNANSSLLYLVAAGPVKRL
jgi:SagB-type dehydrogenase family enzyme